MRSLPVAIDSRTGLGTSTKGWFSATCRAGNIAKGKPANECCDSEARVTEQLRDSIILEVTQTARDIEATYQRVQTTRAASRLRKEQLEGEEERLRVGASTSYQVLQVQNDLLEAQLEEVRALVDYKLAITAHENAVGRILPDNMVVQ